MNCSDLSPINPRISEVLDQVWLIGHSAGSHLCAMLLSSPWYDGLPTAARKVNSSNFNKQGFLSKKF